MLWSAISGCWRPGLPRQGATQSLDERRKAGEAGHRAGSRPRPLAALDVWCRTLPRQVNRDTMSFATKLCHIVYEDGTPRDVMKTPKTDSGKVRVEGCALQGVLARQGLV